MDTQDKVVSNDYWMASYEEVSCLSSLAEILALKDSAHGYLLETKEYHYLCGYIDAYMEYLNGEYQENNEQFSSNTAALMSNSHS
jgi:hypothetical protein